MAVSEAVRAEQRAHVTAEERAAEERERAFLRFHGLARYDLRPRHLARVLGGAFRGDALAWRLAGALGHGDPLDHGRAYGRDRRAVIIVGCPYGDPREAWGPGGLEAMAAEHGLTARVGKPSHYGFGTFQLELFGEAFRRIRAEAEAAHGRSWIDPA